MRAKLLIAVLGMVLLAYVHYQGAVRQSVAIQNTYNSAGTAEFPMETLDVRPYGPELLGQVYERASGGRLDQKQLQQLATELARKRGKDQVWINQFIVGYKHMQEIKR